MVVLKRTLDILELQMQNKKKVIGVFLQNLAVDIMRKLYIGMHRFCLA